MLQNEYSGSISPRPFFHNCLTFSSHFHFHILIPVLGYLSLSDPYCISLQINPFKIQFQWYAYTHTQRLKKPDLLIPTEFSTWSSTTLWPPKYLSCFLRYILWVSKNDNSFISKLSLISSYFHTSAPSVSSPKMPLSCFYRLIYAHFSILGLTLSWEEGYLP